MKSISASVTGFKTSSVTTYMTELVVDGESWTEPIRYSAFRNLYLKLSAEAASDFAFDFPKKGGLFSSPSPSERKPQLDAFVKYVVQYFTLKQFPNQMADLLDSTFKISEHTNTSKKEGEKNVAGETTTHESSEQSNNQLDEEPQGEPLENDPKTDASETDVASQGTCSEGTEDASPTNQPAGEASAAPELENQVEEKPFSTTDDKCPLPEMECAQVAEHVEDNNVKEHDIQEEIDEVANPLTTTADKLPSAQVDVVDLDISAPSKTQPKSEVPEATKAQCEAQVTTEDEGPDGTVSESGTVDELYTDDGETTLGLKKPKRKKLSEAQKRLRNLRRKEKRKRKAEMKMRAGSTDDAMLTESEDEKN